MNYDDSVRSMTSVVSAAQPTGDASPFDLDVGLIYTHEDDWIEPLLRTLSASGPGLNMRLLLVDNASQRGAERWNGYFPTTRVIRNDRRLGYAANLNRVLEAAAARYVLLLNTDMVFDPAERCLTKMVEFMDRRPQCGLSSSRIYRYDGSYAFPARRFPTWRTVVGRRWERRSVFRDEVSRYLYLDADPYRSFACDWLTGCFLMARREAVAAIGPLDEGFRKYFEDVDWCARMTSAGWQVMLCGETYCFHAEQRASKKAFSVDGRRHLRSYVRWLWKYRRGVPCANVVTDENCGSDDLHPRRIPTDAGFMDDDSPNSVVPIEHRAA